MKLKAIFNPAMARKLLKAGNPIKDIKPDNNDIDKTIFLFEVTEKFMSDLTRLSGSRVRV